MGIIAFLVIGFPVSFYVLMDFIRSAALGPRTRQLKPVMIVSLEKVPHLHFPASFTLWRLRLPALLTELTRRIPRLTLSALDTPIWIHWLPLAFDFRRNDFQS